MSEDFSEFPPDVTPEKLRETGKLIEQPKNLEIKTYSPHENRMRHLRQEVYQKCFLAKEGWHHDSCGIRFGHEDRLAADEVSSELREKGFDSYTTEWVLKVWPGK